MSDFNGFPKTALTFFGDLRQNNHKGWFDANRATYENDILEPARMFVVEMGRRLREIAPAITADPRVNKSIFRINRDVRFSKDKSPYKTNLAVLWWEGEGEKLQSPSFYFHVDPDQVWLGVGIYQFSDATLERYRQNVTQPKRAKALMAAIAEVESSGYGVYGDSLKKTPRGYDPQYEYAKLLLYTGLTAGLQTEPMPELHSAALLDYCFNHYQKMLPIYQWLLAMK